MIPPPRQVFTLEHMATGIVRERVYTAEVPKRIGALIIFLELKKIFEIIRVHTLAACVTGGCFIYCAMPLMQKNQH